MLGAARHGHIEYLLAILGREYKYLNIYTLILIRFKRILNKYQMYSSLV